MFDKPHFQCCTKVGNLAPIAAVMLPEASVCRKAAAFERIAGSPFLKRFTVSLLKKNNCLNVSLVKILVAFFATNIFATTTFRQKTFSNHQRSLATLNKLPITRLN